MKDEIINKISNEVKDRGAFSIKNFFDEKQFNSISNSLFDLANKEKKKILFPINLKQFLIKIIKFEFKKFQTSKKLINVSNKLKLKKIASNILGKEAFLETLDCYLSKKSDEQILEWHNDIGYKQDSGSKKNFFNEALATVKEENKASSRGIKFFVHLTDVRSNNGALGIIPYSHKIVTALTKLIAYNKIDLNPYWKLRDLRNYLENKDIREKIIEFVNKDQLNKFIDYSKFININKDTYDFDYQVEKNSAVIFDELCVHRGSAPTKNDRLVLRYLYRRKK